MDTKKAVRLALGYGFADILIALLGALVITCLVDSVPLSVVMDPSRPVYGIMTKTAYFFYFGLIYADWLRIYRIRRKSGGLIPCIITSIVFVVIVSMMWRYLTFWTCLVLIGITALFRYQFTVLKHRHP